MNYLRLKLFALLLIGVGLPRLHAQSMFVKLNDGSQTAYRIDEIRTWTFSPGELTITKMDNSDDKYALRNLRYISFFDYATGLSDFLISNSVTFNIYPNPVENVLKVDLTGSVGNKSRINIFSIDSRLVQNIQLTDSGTNLIDVSHLPRGIYLCRYINGEEIKTIKINKQ